jgi:acetyltransferase-like isoleucine patch superfamily enzyme
MNAEARLSPRHLARDLIVAGMVVLTAPLWALALAHKRLTGRDGVFAACSEILSLVPTILGVFLRRGFYRMTLQACASDCHIGFGTTIAHPEVRIGRGVYIGSRCTLGQVVLEDHVTVGSNVDILSGRHQHHFDTAGEPLQAQGGTYSQIRIGANSWIGNSTVVMADVGAESVVGAGSVVVKPIPAYSVAVGNPAHVKKVREEATQRLDSFQSLDVH